MYSRKVTFISYQILKKIGTYGLSLRKFQIRNITKSLLVGVVLLHADRRTHIKNLLVTLYSTAAMQN